MSKKPTVRESIMTVVDAIVLHNPSYNNTDALQQAADQLASYCESSRNSKFGSLVKEFMGLVPIRFELSTDDVLDHLRKDCNYNG